MTWWMWLLLIVFVIGGINKAAEDKKAKDEAEKRRKDAEDYILKSGDLEAIKLLMLARANPTGQGQFLNGAAPGKNSTLKTAMAVAAGVAVGEVAAGAVAATVVSNALTEAAKTSADASTNVTDLTDLL